jgi:hypothetical protein
MQRSHLRDLMNHVRQGREKADAKQVPAQPRAATPKAVKREGENGEEGEGITIKVLRKGLVVSQEVKLKERGRRPNQNGRENRGISFRKILASEVYSVASLARVHEEPEIGPRNFFGDKRFVVQIRFNQGE